MPRKTKEAMRHRLLACIMLLQRKPRTKPELQQLLGLSETTITYYMKAMQDEGLVENLGTRVHREGVTTGRKAHVWAWVRVEEDQERAAA